jgi:Fic family protein
VPEALGSLVFSLEASVAGVVSEAEEAIRSLNANAVPVLQPLARLFLRTESIASSKVEGLQLGVRELARAEAKADLGMKSSHTAQEILANIDAMILAVEEGAEVATFDVEEIVSIQRRLMERSEHSHLAGKIRTDQNWIGGNDYNPCGADFVPPPPELVRPLLEDLCGAINDHRLSPLVQAAMVHAQFETIHPFSDGNGRTGRALIHVVFKRRGLTPNYIPPISVALAAAKDRYIGGLTNFRGAELEKWIEHFAAAATKSSRLAQAYLKAVASLTKDWHNRVSADANAPRAKAAIWKILEILPAHPIITAPVATAVTGRAKAAVYEGLAVLEKVGVLLPLTTTPRNRVWEAYGLLDLIEGLEAGEQPNEVRQAEM